MSGLKSDFRNLDIYKKAKDFRKNIYNLIEHFPIEEKFLLSNQLLRSSRSIGANIAEGYGRYHYRENIQFCRQARGSMYECLDHLNVALECGYIEKDNYSNLEKDILEMIKMLNGYISFLKKKANS